MPPLGLVACKREFARCRTLLTPKSPDEETHPGCSETYLLEAWVGYLLDTLIERILVHETTKYTKAPANRRLQLSTASSAKLIERKLVFMCVRPILSLTDDTVRPHFPLIYEVPQQTEQHST